MPLNWIFSSMMIFIIMLVAGYIYSEKMELNELKSDVEGGMKIKKNWCW